jgi:hypothetical protein
MEETGREKATLAKSGKETLKADHRCGSGGHYCILDEAGKVIRGLLMEGAEQLPTTAAFYSCGETFRQPPAFLR